ncbi:Uncharacterized membrane protein YebE, DUF533 family [Palleronia salina]|uniref:Uncharacterized membrane protein YebE, DUF533 family n=1 Tax=Palleronia salina TaxID=313368 RepID=A0A1M6AIP2_9RHOB|nr:DUF533 domain-containing protein [Palleronia salina]SHI36352.1 Uncharacterized membrane protein YebE, DUF533 family [Palleronia salina]
MSLKNMAVKMALAFAAAKGVQAYQQAGGMDGIRRKLAQQKAQGGSAGAPSSTGGLDGLLGQLGLGGGGGSAGGSSSLGGLLGGLAGVAGGSAGAGKMKGLLDTTRETPADTAEEEQVSGLMIRAMIQAARADGEIDQAERATLMEIIGDSDPQETAFIQAQMTAPVDPEALARDTPQGHEIEVYTSAVLAIDPDNRAEAVFLDTLAKGLSLGQQQVNDIHDAQGKPPLYTV